MNEYIRNYGKHLVVLDDNTVVYKGQRYVVCKCDCHNVGTHVLHMFPCCDLCYSGYIVDGNIDFDLFIAAMEANIKFRISKGDLNECDLILNQGE